MERKLVLKDDVTVEDIRNLVLSFLDSYHEENPDLVQCKLWEEFYHNMTILE